MRTAIDRYKQAVDQGKIGGTDVKVGSEGYPPDLETLVKGVSQVGQARRQAEVPAADPRRPHDGQGGVGDALLPGRRRRLELVRGERLGRVLARAQGKALDGSKYREW